MLTPPFILANQVPPIPPPPPFLFLKSHKKFNFYMSQWQLGLISSCYRRALGRPCYSAVWVNLLMLQVVAAREALLLCSWG
jgi:hypothetical protein